MQIFKPSDNCSLLVSFLQCHLTNRPQFSVVYTVIDHRNDVIKCSKTQVEPRASGEWFHLKSFEHFMASFLWSIRV